MNKLLYNYKNGNYFVEIYKDGTKIRYGDVDEFIPEFPESIDLKITNYCEGLCKYCYEESNKKGNYADEYKFFELLDGKFRRIFNKKYRGIEVAIGGGNVLSYPYILTFVQKLDVLGMIPNITVSQYNLINPDYYDKFRYIRDNNLVKGIGLTINDINLDIPEKTLNYPHLVFHLILGVHNISDIHAIIDKYKLEKPTFLILGYKYKGNGIRHFNSNGSNLSSNFTDWYNNVRSLFSVCGLSFDNLAIEQLNMKRFFTDEEWSKYYMGDDGQFSMYIDLVNMQYAKNSISNKRFNIQKEDNLTTIFKRVKEDEN